MQYPQLRFTFEAAVIRVRPRFFDQVGHQTTNAPSGNKYFFTKFHHQTYQKYEQSRKKIGPIFSKKKSKFSKKIININ